MAANCRAIRLLSYYREPLHYKREGFSIPEKMGDSTVALPLYAKFSNEDIQCVIKGVIALTASQAKFQIYTCPIRASIKGGVRWTTYG